MPSAWVNRCRGWTYPWLDETLFPCSHSLCAAGCCFRVGGCAGRTAQHWTLAPQPRRDTSSLPSSPALFEAGGGPGAPRDQKSQQRESEQVAVLLVGWFALAVLSVLTAVFCCSRETALPSPWTTLCQQEVLTCEIKCSIRLKWLNEEQCFPLECSLCLGMGSCKHQYFHFHISVEQNK